MSLRAGSLGKGAACTSSGRRRTVVLCTKANGYDELRTTLRDKLGVKHPYFPPGPLQLFTFITTAGNATYWDFARGFLFGESTTELKKGNFIVSGGATSLLSEMQPKPKILKGKVYNPDASDPVTIATGDLKTIKLSTDLEGAVDVQQLLQVAMQLAAKYASSTECTGKTSLTALQQEYLDPEDVDRHVAGYLEARLQNLSKAERNSMKLDKYKGLYLVTSVWTAEVACEVIVSANKNASASQSASADIAKIAEALATIKIKESASIEIGSNGSASCKFRSDGRIVVGWDSTLVLAPNGSKGFHAPSRPNLQEFQGTRDDISASAGEASWDVIKSVNLD